jgi:dienelactone hydrolase
MAAVPHRPVALCLAVALLGLVAAVPADQPDGGADLQVGPHPEVHWRTMIRNILHVPDPLPPLAPQTHGRFEPTAGVTAERVTYGTQFGMRVPAVLYLPRPLPPGKIPALVIVNGHGGDKYSWYAFYAGIAYARAGAAVLTYDPTGEGERNSERKSGTRAHDVVEPPDELARRLGGLMVTDVLQAVSYLATRPEVDPGRIAAAGYSMGSFILSLAGAIETRLHAVVLVGGGNLDGPDEYWDNTKPMCQGIPYRSLRPLGDRAAVIYRLHASRGPTLVFNGLEDDTVRIPKNALEFFEDLRLRTGRLAGRSDTVFDVGFVPGAGHRPFFVTPPVAGWLERQLDFPNWQGAEIVTMPTTHVSEWARTERVEMDPLYATEHREGGTRAVGTGVPGLGRDDLSVFSPEEWRRQQSLLVHERWRELARAQLGR